MHREVVHQAFNVPDQGTHGIGRRGDVGVAVTAQVGAQDAQAGEQGDQRVEDGTVEPEGVQENERWSGIGAV